MNISQITSSFETAGEARLLAEAGNRALSALIMSVIIERLRPLLGRFRTGGNRTRAA
ncbi:hypothetical protein [Rhizosaccharibacter radicis]|uniref:Uncharacterized protein n=1 Tax=Rhizosaccharibacter radicis TaxID=2782605 RepID=A0ABT1VUQ4_9PROT|nr:hypothetical protein [Acetobacteraceae bacterium KSS12]